MTDKVWTPQRWDRGKWDQAVWNGQLGFNAQVGSIVLTGYDTNLVVHLHVDYRIDAAVGSIVVTGYDIATKSTLGLSADTAAIVVTGYDTVFHSGLSIPVEAGEIVLTGLPADLSLSYTMHLMAGVTSQIIWTGYPVEFEFGYGPTQHHPPGPLQFGIPRVIVPRRW